jgi:hypothetical protein
MPGRVDDSDPHGRIQDGVAEEVQFAACSPRTCEAKNMCMGKKLGLYPKGFLIGPRSKECDWAEGQIVRSSCYRRNVGPHLYKIILFDGAQIYSVLT